MWSTITVDIYSINMLVLLAVWNQAQKRTAVVLMQENKCTVYRKQGGRMLRPEYDNGNAFQWQKYTYRKI